MKIMRTIPGRVTTAENTVIKVRMLYDTADPYAISVTFIDPRPDVDDSTWLFARDLILDAFRDGYAGEGDVMVKADHRLVTISLSAPEGEGVVELHRPDVYMFIAGIYHVVPRGQEPKEYDVDAFLTQVLDS